MAFADAGANAVIISGETPAPILLASTVSLGDAVGYSGGWQAALSATGGVIQIRCVAGEDGVAGQTITAYFDSVTIAGARFSGATAGSALYVDETTAGNYTSTIPTDTGDATTVAGYMITATLALIMPAHAADSIA